MVARIWLCVFSVVILPYLSAKPVSLNKLIEAEETLPSENTPRISKPDIIVKPLPSNKLLEDRNKPLPRQRTIQSEATREKTTKQRTGPSASRLTKLSKAVSGTIFSHNKNPSPLHYRKTFEIKSPIKPKRVTLFQRTRLRNRSGKQETYQHGAINKEYIPLLRNLGLLFDNILGPDPGDTDEDYSNSEERICTCVSKRSREPRQKAAASTRVSVTETTPPTETSTASTPSPTPDNVGSVGRHQNVSLLFTRNTTGVWRNHFGLGAGSGSSHLGSPERYIAGDSGDDERHPGDGEAGTNPENDEEDPNRPVGDHAGDDGSRAGVIPGFVGKSVLSRKFKTSPNKTAEGLGGLVPEYKGEIQFEIRTDEAKGSRAVPKLDTGLRATKKIQAKEKDPQRGDSSDQQFVVGDGEDTEEDKKLRGTYEGVSFDTSNISSDFDPSDQNDKYVMIYDGYSVARDVNGKNTLTEKAITIHS